MNERNEIKKVRDYIPLIFNGGYRQIRVVSSGGYWQYYDKGNDIPYYYWDFEVFYIKEDANDGRTKTITIYLK
jgi:hypothetical protein